MSVFVLDRSGKPLMPCSEKRARLLLERGRARVHRLHPFTIRVIDRHRATCALQPMRLSIDPGSKATGLALCRVSTSRRPRASSKASATSTAAPSCGATAMRTPALPQQSQPKKGRGKPVTLWRDALYLPMDESRGFPRNTR